jgi:hypothetical protein
VEEQETRDEAEVVRIDPAPPKSRRPRKRPDPEEEEDAEAAEVAEEERPRRRPKAARAEDDTEEDERPRRRGKARGRAANWRKVRLGLLLMLVAAGAGLAVAVILNVGLRLSLSSAGGIFASAQSILSWMRFMQFVTFCLTAVAITGYCFCLFAPREHACRRLAIAVLVIIGLDWLAQAVFDPLNLSSLGLGGQSVETMLDQARRGDLSGLQKFSLDMSAWVQRIYLFGLFLQILGYVKVLIAPLFLWSLTRCLRGSGLTYQAETLLKISAWIVGLGILTQLLFRLPLGVVMSLLTPLSWVSMLLGLAQAGWMLLLMINIRRAIADKLDNLGADAGS